MPYSNLETGPYRSCFVLSLVDSKLFLGMCKSSSGSQRTFLGMKDKKIFNMICSAIKIILIYIKNSFLLIKTA
jgi:hypothetical protein